MTFNLDLTEGTDLGETGAAYDFHLFEGQVSIGVALRNITRNGFHTSRNHGTKKISSKVVFLVYVLHDKQSHNTDGRRTIANAENIRTLEKQR
ncbi:hypothetical protein TNIN_33511 [Trichonephila inaurata madagascariensis]|uniref:Uncharacterized protein n=1 Tax=Trichonephila inaurata madagascariensis TaxID=2747483 RepID=A0A8X6YL57_9ARAC|nr:hypothetical protein TNIN_33511 [Trichonephila inaurata madagascariensis]